MQESIDLFKDLTKAEKEEGRLRGYIAGLCISTRQRLGYSQTEFAEFLEISSRKLVKIEECRYDFRMSEYLVLKYRLLGLGE